tara:strand:- start:793 stop:969 length:177 start_codon:yes stop_codon:yes gene_type:complete
MAGFCGTSRIQIGAGRSALRLASEENTREVYFSKAYKHVTSGMTNTAANVWSALVGSS